MTENLPRVSIALNSHEVVSQQYDLRTNIFHLFFTESMAYNFIQIVSIGDILRNASCYYLCPDGQMLTLKALSIFAADDILPVILLNFFYR